LLLPDFVLVAGGDDRVPKDGCKGIKKYLIYAKMAAKKSSFSAFSAKMVVIRQIFVILYPLKAVFLQTILEAQH